MSANLAGAWLDVSDARFSRTRGVQRCDGKLLGERVWGELALDTNNTSARLDISVERELQVQGEHALGEHGLFAASKPPPEDAPHHCTLASLWAHQIRSSA